MIDQTRRQEHMLMAIAASRRLVGHFKSSSRATVELVRRQETMQMQEPLKKLI